MLLSNILKIWHIVQSYANFQKLSNFSSHHTSQEISLQTHSSPKSWWTLPKVIGRWVQLYTREHLEHLSFQRPSTEPCCRTFVLHLCVSFMWIAFISKKTLFSSLVSVREWLFEACFKEWTRSAVINFTNVQYPVDNEIVFYYYCNIFTYHETIAQSHHHVLICPQTSINLIEFNFSNCP